MEEGCKQALRDNHQKLRSGLRVENVLADFRRYLTDVEYSRVEDQPGNVAQVDELIKILLTKEDKHFDGLCRVLERDGYQHLARHLRANAYASRRREPEGRRAQCKARASAVALH